MKAQAAPRVVGVAGAGADRAVVAVDRGFPAAADFQLQNTAIAVEEEPVAAAVTVAGEQEAGVEPTDVAIVKAACLIGGFNSRTSPSF